MPMENFFGPEGVKLNSNRSCSHRITRAYSRYSRQTPAAECTTKRDLIISYCYALYAMNSTHTRHSVHNDRFRQDQTGPRTHNDPKRLHVYAVDNPWRRFSGRVIFTYRRGPKIIQQSGCVKVKYVIDVKTFQKKIKTLKNVKNVTKFLKIRL